MSDPKVPISKTIRKTKPKPQPVRQQMKPQCGPSIVELLGGRIATPPVAESSLSRPRQAVLDAASYLQKLQDDIGNGRLLLQGSPWVVPDDAFQAAGRINDARSAAMEELIGPDEALHLVLRPTVFVWAPQKLLPESSIRCPHCDRCATKVRWCRARVLHRLDGQCLYLATRHTCDKCPANLHRRDVSFQADSPDVIASLPDSLRQLWTFKDTGRTLVDVELVNFCCSMATRSSWATAASIVHEMKATRWMRESTLRYLKLCDVLSLTPSETPKEVPAAYELSKEWVRDLCIKEFHHKAPETLQQIVAERGDDILVLDWTKDAASRCGGNWMFNAMSGARKILASVITNSSGPHEVEPVVRSLKCRGVEPKVVYVDDECCGAWRPLLQNLWPEVVIRLDGYHAIRRLTGTTTSTQHPWHGTFCAQLSKALYTYDAGELRRLQEARTKAGESKALPKETKSKYVPRVIADAERIEKAIGFVIESFANRSHDEMGPLLTPQTQAAWENLRVHVRGGCLCDPPGTKMHMVDEQKSVTIGGEIFKPIKTLRGASALEGFHAHQKQWLGMFAHHSTEAGLALIREGTLRWNRQRSNEASDAEAAIPLVFASGLLREADCLHQRLTGSKLYPAHSFCAGTFDAPVACVARHQER